MNKFRANLHPAFFKETAEKPNTPEEEKVLDQARKEEKELLADVRRNNEALASSVEQVEQDEVTDKELSKQLKQLAKNKKIDFPWTDNEWKCSRTEKRLAISSAKVFQQLLEQWKLQQMINLLKSQNWELTKDVVMQWNENLWINSKVKDIQNFYKAYQEYQRPQSSYQHLKNLIWFFCENGFESMDKVREDMKNRSQKISKSDIRKQWSELYKEWWQKDENGEMRYMIIDKRTGEEIDCKPKDVKQRAAFEIIKGRLNENKSIGEVDKMLTLLWDFNLDGEVNSGDVGYKTWTQLADVFRRSVATEQMRDSKFDSNKAVTNLVAYANKFGMGIENVQTADQLYQWMTDKFQWYENTRKLQDFVKNLSIEIEDVLVNWEKAWASSLDHIVKAIEKERAEEAKANKKAEEKISADKWEDKASESKESDAEAVKKAAEDKTKEILTANEQKFKELIKDATERANLMQQLAAQLPWILVDHANNVQRGLWVWMRVPLDQIIRWASAWFHTGLDSKWNPKFWLFVGWDKKFNLSKSTDVSTAINTGANLLFIPCASASLELWHDIKQKSREESLDAKWEGKITLGWNVSITWGIFSRGASAGYENNKQAWIEKQSKHINEVIKNQSKKWLQRIMDIEKKEDWVRILLLQDFPKASEEDLQKATNNLLSIIKQFKIDEKTTDADFDTYAQIIADVYSEQWRNAALTWISDNKRKISWWKLGIQFFAGFIPVGTAVMKFTKYYNARTNETEHSRMARIDAQVNGTGNEAIALQKNKEWVSEIWEAQVKQINEILKRYGAKQELSYFEWQDGKPGKIAIPQSVADGIGINIHVSPSMKGCVQEMDGAFFFPANATYRLLQETGGNQRSITLNVGSDRHTQEDINFSDYEKMQSFIWAEEIKSGKKLEFTDKINKWQLDHDPQFIKDLFTPDVVKWLIDIDSSNRRKFSEFMKTKRDAVDNFDSMVNALINVLWKDKKYEAIVNKLSDPATSQEDKQLIIDRVMAISVDTNVHNKAGLEEHAKQRWDFYRKESMKGPNGRAIFKELEVRRDDFIKNTVDNYDNKPVANILWATAFYHRNNTAKWLAITWLGATHVFWWKTQELSSSDRTKVENWFLWNKEWDNYVAWVFEKSPVEWSNLKRVIKEKIWLPVDLSDDNLKSLLKWEEVTLDNSGKKVKVKLDVKYVFYLMWECANESVGMQFWDLQVQEEHEVDDYSQWALYLNNIDGSSSVNVSRRDAAVGVTFGWWQKKKKEQEENSAVKTEWETHSTELPETQTQTDEKDDKIVETDNTADDWDSTGATYEEF